MRVEWSPRAVSDLQNISNYIEKASTLQTANRITGEIYNAVQSLRSLPGRGRPGRVEGTRELVRPNLPYIVVYKSSPERVIVVNIVHGAQRWP